MDILYAIGAVSLLILLIDRLVDFPWWAQLSACVTVAVAVTALRHANYWAVPLETFAGITLSTIQAALLHYIQRPQVVAPSNRNTIPVVW